MKMKVEYLRFGEVTEIESARIPIDDNTYEELRIVLKTVNGIATPHLSIKRIDETIAHETELVLSLEELGDHLKLIQSFAKQIKNLKSTEV
ncbi:hypothetical protein EEL31_09335 [Brevibacillus laterosporus]|nr:hypothetical protein [Brevibacillus laterosporus]TPG68707.1 hypothetical protein EEL31_09335 [Brevibacillus laterosporus]